MAAIWVLLLALGIGGAAVASRRTVGHALDIADRLGVSKGVIGVTVVAIGTDLPEIANSISASVAGHGDINVGDSTGSALTQVTLVLALLVLVAPSFVSRAATDGRELVVPVGSITVCAVVLIAVLVLDGDLTRLDGALLVAVWVATMAWMGHRFAPAVDARRVRASAPPRVVAALGGWLAVLAASAVLVVRAFIEVADTLGVPELLASTIVLALGTSLPELLVDMTAIRRGAAALALGDLFGSSLIDSTLSIGIGPVVRPTAVSDGAVPSVLVVAVGVAVTTWLVGRAGHTGRQLALELIAVYAACAGALIAISP